MIHTAICEPASKMSSKLASVILIFQKADGLECTITDVSKIMEISP